MCGVPVHAAESYLARLIRAGHRVAIAEQIETPAEAKARGGSKALVARDIVRFVTAGTLTEESLLEGRSANRLAALAQEIGRHTSELQSLMRISYAVFCLKKKTSQRQTTTKQVKNLHTRRTRNA